MRFPLTPHTKAILSGNGLPKDSNSFKEGRGMRLICSAPQCIHATGQTNDPLFERAIKVMGYTKCSRCGKQSEVTEYCALVKNDARKRQQIPICPYCGKHPVKLIYTQFVVSKHRKKNHYFYHAECYDAMYIGEDGEFKPKRYKTRYAGTHGGGCVVYLSFDPRKGICQGCGKSVEKQEIKLTALHHWKYAYQPETVQKNPVLVLENTSEFCFACHQIADGLRSIMKFTSNEKVINVSTLMPKELKERLVIICNMYLKSVVDEYREKVLGNESPS